MISLPNYQQSLPEKMDSTMVNTFCDGIITIKIEKKLTKLISFQFQQKRVNLSRNYNFFYPPMDQKYLSANNLFMSGGCSNLRVPVQRNAECKKCIKYILCLRFCFDDSF